ncbi:DNA-binding protein [Pedobacter panaciterrae]|uniref:DNA-binding protein n=1 Tax=Pedobacter panaciterrae TaxID=363849 RepID=UPI00155DDC57|nr:DNA-binding protein [Pedobacter panaciterrae]NQX56863.1 DNA-binding protein [Pedobacter panaciterrae]
MKDLTSSNIHRKNVLNNNPALKEIYKELSFPGIIFEGKYRFTKRQVATFYEVDDRTVERYIESNVQEFKESGYEIIQGNELKIFKLLKVGDKHVVDLPELGIDKFAPSLGIFSFKAFLNLGMLLTDSDNAKLLRTLVLNIVIDTLNKKVGGKTKYINQREEEFVSSAIREYNYREAFTNAIDEFIEPNKFKYSQLTDKIYKSIFKENAKEYRQILNLNYNESVRSTMYSEVLDLIASYENGFSSNLKKTSEQYNRKLKLSEANSLFREFELQSEALYLPLIEKARSIMASRDMALRDAMHEKLKNYITYLNSEDFEKFLGERSMALEDTLSQNKEVFQRLKDR